MFHNFKFYILKDYVFLQNNVRKFDHITPIHYKLHWLPVNQRIQFKIIILTFKALHGSAPPYVHDLVTPRTTRPGLRSIRNTLHVPRTRLVSYGDRSYSNIAPRLWNSLPDYLRQINTQHHSLPSETQNTLIIACFPTS